MRGWRRELAEGKVGAGSIVRFSRTFTAEDVKTFGHVTRDYNPVHCEPRFTALKGFSGPICHGLLVGSMICEPGGQWGWLAAGMNFRFLKPVYIGDTIACEMAIVELDDRGRARAHATLTNQKGETVLEADLKGFLPSPEERALLAAMLAEGDPSNPLTPRP
jgi:acyl dehydratase